MKNEGTGWEWPETQRVNIREEMETTSEQSHQPQLRH